MTDTIQFFSAPTGPSSPEQSSSGPDHVAADAPEDGGETGALIRSIDWTNSPLGPIETWSPSLRTALSILLASEVAMFVWWGPGLVNLFNGPPSPQAQRTAKTPRSRGFSWRLGVLAVDPGLLADR